MRLFSGRWESIPVVRVRHPISKRYFSYIPRKYRIWYDSYILNTLASLFNKSITKIPTEEHYHPLSITFPPEVLKRMVEAKRKMERGEKNDSYIRRI